MEYEVSDVEDIRKDYCYMSTKLDGRIARRERACMCKSCHEAVANGLPGNPGCKNNDVVGIVREEDMLACSILQEKSKKKDGDPNRTPYKVELMKWVAEEVVVEGAGAGAGEDEVGDGDGDETDLESQTQAMTQGGRKRLHSEMEGDSRGEVGSWFVKKTKVKKDMIIFFLHKKEGREQYDVRSGKISEVNGRDITVCCQEENSENTETKNWNGKYMFCSTTGTKSSRVDTIKQDDALTTRMKEKLQEFNTSD
ncbi:hypothetical protein TrCOL_g9375 [Triparma columacea]|uniref:Uncharacterized protein n=1 Tax=Triparma columacea TaxID=722753 RepID=A0A9W7G0C1_9STRA|nr:hypothetical protein TrCOL_g9375 [Triparma columacea]